MEEVGDGREGPVDAERRPQGDEALRRLGVIAGGRGRADGINRDAVGAAPDPVQVVRPKAARGGAAGSGAKSGSSASRSEVLDEQVIRAGEGDDRSSGTASTRPAAGPPSKSDATRVSRLFA